ncbi:MAG: miaB, partial [Citricoccus sp.]|nr:miaB [Citricoccus sp. WCRC_4]
VPKHIVQERFERLTALQDRISAEETAKLLGTRQELLVTNQPGSKGAETGRLAGRAPDNRLVHFSVPAGEQAPRPGDFVTVTITESHPYHLIADPTAQDYRLRRSRSGDAWDRAQAESCGVPAPGGAAGAAGTAGVSLGMPSLRVGS